jgi:hypothetical protein
MKAILFPHSFKTISGWVFYLASAAGLFYLLNLEWLDDIAFFEVTVPNIFRLQVEFFENDRSFWIYNNILDEILIFLVTISGLIHCFSAESIEDEFITNLRYHSLAWSLFLNGGLLLFATAFVYGTAYLSFMGFFMVSILLLFNLKFRFELFKHYKS